MSCRSSGFTAYYAHKRALHNANRLTPGCEKVSCKSCEGKGAMKLRMTTLEDGKWSAETMESIPCVHCKDGLVNPLQQLYRMLIWCKCKSSAVSASIYAADGRRVFGNTTYLCGCCGFVKQFG